MEEIKDLHTIVVPDEYLAKVEQFKLISDIPFTFKGRE